MSVLEIRLSPKFESIEAANLSRSLNSSEWKQDLQLAEFTPEHIGRFSPRLIVLVPTEPFDSTRLIKAISPLLVPPITVIVFVALGTFGDEVSSERLERLVRRAKSQKLKSYSQLIPATQWLHAVEMIVRPGDIVVCHAEQQGWNLAQILTQQLGIKTHILSGHYPSRTQRVSILLGKIGFELLPLLLIVLFFLLQVQIEANTVGWVTTICLVVSVLIEIGLLVLWSLFIW